MPASLDSSHSAETAVGAGRGRMVTNFNQALVYCVERLTTCETPADMLENVKKKKKKFNSTVLLIRMPRQTKMSDNLGLMTK